VAEVRGEGKKAARRYVSRGRFTIEDILHLAATDAKDAEAHLGKIFDWYHNRESAFVKGCATASAGAVLALIATAADTSTHLDAALVVALAGTVVLLALAAWWQNVHLGHLHREYLVSVRILCRLSAFRKQLDAYLRSREG
jgi:hypothetical protein